MCAYIVKAHEKFGKGILLEQGRAACHHEMVAVFKPLNQAVILEHAEKPADRNSGDLVPYVSSVAPAAFEMAA